VSVDGLIRLNPSYIEDDTMLLVLVLAIGFTVALMVSPKLRFVTALILRRALFLNGRRNNRQASNVYARG